MFTDPITEQLKYYVYLLVDPRNNQLFYIGKGINNRVFAHLKDEISDESETSLKQSIIKEIHADGKEVQIYIARHGLDEETAFEIESTLIDFTQFESEKQLSNIVSGHHANERGIMTLNEILQTYGAEEADITDPVIIININQKYKRGMSSEQIYEATRLAWVVNKSRAEKAKYVLATFRGIVKEVFFVHWWKPSEYEGKMEFDGEVASDEVSQKYRNKSVIHYAKTGAQNPIKYVN
jgi:hypothetical protein